MNTSRRAVPAPAGSAPPELEADPGRRDPVVTRELRPSDVPAVAALHRALFPDYFLSHLGQAFVERFYAGFAAGGPDLGFVAEVAGELVGFVVGTIEPYDVYGRFYRRNLVRLAPDFAVRLLTDPVVRAQVRPRLPHLGLAARSLLVRHGRRAASGADAAPSAAALPMTTTPSPAAAPPAPLTTAAGAPPTARLMSIALHPDHRGSGLADALAARFCERCAARGIDLVGLSVRFDNARAIAFYDRSGWRRERVSAAGINFVRHAAA